MLNALIASLLFCMSSSPMPRQVTRNSAGRFTQVKGNAAQNNGLPATAPIQNQKAAPSNQSEGNNPAPEREPRHVIIDRGQGKDAWDKVYIVLTGILVFIGGATLVAIWYQAVQNRKSADAALQSATATAQNVEALINIERAWIEGELVEDEEAKKISVVRYVLKIRNHGKTPAYLLNYEVERKVSKPNQSFDIVGFDVTSKITLNRFLASDATDFFDPFDMKDTFGDGCETGTLYFVIRYTDMLGGREGRERHETSFLYYYVPLIEKLDRVNTFSKYT